MIFGSFFLFQIAPYQWVFVKAITVAIKASFLFYQRVSEGASTCLIFTDLRPYRLLASIKYLTFRLKMTNVMNICHVAKS